VGFDSGEPLSGSLFRELLVGIFWEETMYTNRKQLQGPAVGFGQVEPGNDESRQRLLRHKLLSELDSDR